MSTRSKTFAALGGGVVNQEQCTKAQRYLMSLETAENLSGLLKLATAR